MTKRKAGIPATQVASVGDNGELIEYVSFTVDTPNLFASLAESAEVLGSAGPGYVFGFEIILRNLARIGKIAMDHKDMETLGILEELGIVEIAPDEKQTKKGKRNAVPKRHPKAA